eukprot:7757055-Alexandrium_andersonii.AAC.1
MAAVANTMASWLGKAPPTDPQLVAEAGAAPGWAEGTDTTPATPTGSMDLDAVSYTHLRAHETSAHL